MITKTLGTIVVILLCIFLFPVGIGIVAGVFGTVAGVFGAIFGIIGGAIGAIFGAIFGVFGWIFDGLFDWHWPHAFFNCNVFALAAIVLILALITRPKKGRIS